MIDSEKRAAAAQKMEAIAREYGFTAGVLFLGWPTTAEKYEACGHSFGAQNASAGCIVEVMAQGLSIEMLEGFCSELRSRGAFYESIKSGKVQ